MNYTTAKLIQRYRKRAGMNLFKSSTPEKARRKTSLEEEVSKRFPDSTLTKSRLVVLESQDSKRHREPTPQELYQMAVVLNVPMMALIIDTEDPYGNCQIAHTENPHALGRIPEDITNMQVISEQVLQWGATDTDTVSGYVVRSTYVPLGNDPFAMCKYAEEASLLASLLPSVVQHHPDDMTQSEMQSIQYRDEQSAGLMMEEVRELQINGVDIPADELAKINNALQQVKEYWESRRRYAVPLDDGTVREFKYEKTYQKGDFKPNKKNGSDLS